MKFAIFGAAALRLNECVEIVNDAQKYYRLSVKIDASSPQPDAPVGNRSQINSCAKEPCTKNCFLAQPNDIVRVDRKSSYSTETFSTNSQPSIAVMSEAKLH